MRILFIQPIVHTSADMGSVKEALAKRAIARLGRKEWQKHQRKIEEFWNKVEEAIGRLDLDYSKVRVFQDGMPAGGELALRIVDETAKKGSKNYQIVKKMIERGARIEQTESEDLLLKEYNYIKEFASAEKEKKEAAQREYEKVKDELLRKRDEFIARRIDEALKEREVGFLFIGARHNVKPLLAGDIKVKELG